MQKPIELCYASWKTRLREAVHHLAIAETLWESCVNIAYHCEEFDPRREHLKAMQDGEPLAMVDILHRLQQVSDELQEAELRGEEAMKARENENGNSAPGQDVSV